MRSHYVGIKFLSSLQLSTFQMNYDHPSTPQHPQVQRLMHYNITSLHRHIIRSNHSCSIKSKATSPYVGTWIRPQDRHCSGNVELQNKRNYCITTGLIANIVGLILVKWMFWALGLTCLNRPLIRLIEFICFKSKRVIAMKTCSTRNFGAINQSFFDDDFTEEEKKKFTFWTIPPNGFTPLSEPVRAEGWLTSCAQDRLGEREYYVLRAKEFLKYKVKSNSPPSVTLDDRIRVRQSLSGCV